jgi:peroxiredoxin (alkyl hydroperoxide reductase subunit C)
MSDEMEAGCARPTGGPVGVVEDSREATEEPIRKEVSAMLKVGKPVPDFSAPAYHRGKFVNVKLSEFLGKWVLLCFYPGDFTFV